jgi:uncharacterized protein with HEPN domain
MMGANVPALDEFVARLLKWSALAIEIGSRKPRAEFLKDIILQMAAAKGLEQIGETSRLLLQEYPDFCAANPQLEWRQMVAMRNRLSHGYDGADNETVYFTIETYVPHVRDFASDWLKSRGLKP